LRYDEEDRLYEAGGTAYRHDEDGFLVSKTQGTQVTTYDYSLRGELLSVTLPDGRVIAYVHDPLGRRLAKKVNGSVVEKYLWEGLTRLLAVYDGSDNLLMRFEYADVRMPVAMTAGGVKYYLAYDQVGTLKAVADASGNVVKKIEYDTFGNILGDSNPAFAVPFGFAGGLYDKDTGLVRFGYRDYDPDTGRWTAKDPILFAGGDTDLYGYCVNDPVNLTDPDGLRKIAQTHITFTGEVKITYYQDYYNMSPLLQNGVRIHENIHVEQLMPYVNWGWFGNFVYMFNQVEWELGAYRAQACYLEKELKKAKRKSPEWYQLYYELDRIEWNMGELERMK